MSDAWVFHRGSLGDSVLLWPVLRALRAAGRNVTLVSDASKAALAAAELGIIGVSAEQPRWNALWLPGPGAPGGAAAALGGPDLDKRPLVLSFLADPVTPAGRTWVENARRAFPRAEIIAEPRRVDRVVALEYAARFGGAPPVPVRRNPRGPVVIHVGAGSEDKRLTMEWWVGWIRDATVRERGSGAACSMREMSVKSLPDGRGSEETLPHGRGCEETLPHGRVSYVAGEVERERFTPHERALFSAAGGTYIDDLPALAATLKSARLYVGADTGPTHLAAALGVPTIALFGPTDPQRWAPVGPTVRIVRLAPASLPR